jgi:hypothetical protein
MELSVKVAWNGMVAIRDKYYEKARKDGLTIKHDNKTMKLTPEEVRSKIVLVSKPMPNKFSGKVSHKLLYYYESKI